MGMKLNHCLMCGVGISPKKEKKVRFVGRNYFVHTRCEPDFKIESAKAKEINQNYFLLSNKGKELDSKHIGIFERKVWLSGGARVGLWVRTLKLGINNDEDYEYEMAFGMFEKLFKCKLKQPTLDREKNSTELGIEEDSDLHELIEGIQYGDK